MEIPLAAQIAFVRHELRILDEAAPTLATDSAATLAALDRLTYLHAILESLLRLQASPPSPGPAAAP